MQLPAELVTIISLFLVGVVSTLVTDGFKSLSEALHFDLSSVAKIVAAAAAVFAVSVVIGLINLTLGFVPPAYYPIIQSIFVVLIGTFGAMGLHRRNKMSRPEPPQG